jgi:hypothetical protein
MGVGGQSLDDGFRSRRPLKGIGVAGFQFLRKEAFVSARITAKRLAISPDTINKILPRDLGMRKFMR